MSFTRIFIFLISLLLFANIPLSTISFSLDEEHNLNESVFTHNSLYGKKIIDDKKQNLGTVIWYKDNVYLIKSPNSYYYFVRQNSGLLFSRFLTREKNLNNIVAFSFSITSGLPIGKFYLEAEFINSKRPTNVPAYETYNLSYTQKSSLEDAFIYNPYQKIWEQSSNSSDIWITSNKLFPSDRITAGIPMELFPPYIVLSLY